MRRALSVVGLVAAAALASAVPAMAAPTAGSPTPQPVGHHAVKGIPSAGTTTSGAHTDAGPFPPTLFYYSGAAVENTAADGASADITVEQPVVGPADFHANAEIAAQSTDSRQIVEIGWIVDANLNGDTLPHLFVFHWINGVDTCYNGCGWVPYARAPFFAGQDLPIGRTMNFAIQHITTASPTEPTAVPGWQLSVNGIPFGEFPDTEWNGTYTQVGLAQYFGEVAASASQPPCTQLGDGEFASSPTAAQFSNITLINGPAVNFTRINVTNPAYYTFNQTSSNSFRFGGPGSGC